MCVWSVSALDKVRLAVQIVFTAVTNGYYRGFAQGSLYQGKLKEICVPGLNCYSCPGALGSCPVGAMQSVFAEKGSTVPLYVIGFLMAVGALAGRAVCGWLCPFGLVQDLLHRIPVPAKINNVPWDRPLRYLKYVILALFVILLPMMITDKFGMGKTWFCEYICPAGTLAAGWPLVLMDEGIAAMTGFLFAWKTVILAVLLVLSVFIYRPFCRYLCPLGAVYGLCSKASLYRYSLDSSLCVSCGSCADVCGMGVDPSKDPNSAECIRCGKCLQACPTGALRRQPVRRDACRTSVDS